PLYCSSPFLLFSVAVSRPLLSFPTLRSSDLRHPHLPPGYPWRSPASSTFRYGNTGQGLRSLRDLTQHLTTRADDSHAAPILRSLDRKSTRLNSSHQIISYAVFCLKKKKTTPI